MRQHHHRASNHSTNIKPGYLCIIADPGRKESMNYKRLSLIELSRYRYPNLLAEIIESGYSICTIAEYMGLGRYRREDDPEVWARLAGSIEMTVANMCGLLQLYNVKQEYLFSDTLSIKGGVSEAYWRWYDENKIKEKKRNLSACRRCQTYTVICMKIYILLLMCRQ